MLFSLLYLGFLELRQAGPLVTVVRERLTAVASLVAEPRLWDTKAAVVAVPRL